jgi:hypothetical protein
MGLFRRNKQAGQMAEIDALMGRNMELAKQGLAEQGFDMQSLMGLAQQAMQPGAADGLLAQRDRAQKLFKAGVEMPATLRGIALGESSPLIGGVPAQLELTVEPPGGAPYDVSTDQVLHEAMAKELVAGQRVTVRVDPDDPSSVICWGTTAPATGPDDRLAKLERLHAMGALTDDELAAEKAKI